MAESMLIGASLINIFIAVWLVSKIVSNDSSINAIINA